MNILPKKSWHVRNRDNIARVRKDEAEAAEKEKETERRKRLAEQEAKIKFMRKQTQLKYGIPTKKEELPVSEPTTINQLEHVNFFQDLEEGAVVSTAKNKEHEQEVKDEKEKYEKQIGYLTYLGQDTNEATGKVSWYEKCRSELLDDNNDEEREAQKKNTLDPIFKYKTFFDRHKFVPKKVEEKPKPQCMEADFTLKKKSRKHKKHKSNHKKRKHSDSSSSASTDEEYEKLKQQKLQILRQQRLKREKEEKARSDKVLAKMRGEIEPESVKDPVPFIQKYNSQFNPHLAKQNISR